MPDGHFLIHARRARWTTMALIAVACSRADSPPLPNAGSAPAAATSAGTGTCPPTGLWAECSILYRLERSGFVAKIDSGAKPKEKALTGKPLVLSVGRGATLEIFLYPDTASRVADGAKLDRAHLVNATAEQTIERERTLIESANIIGLLTSLSGSQRERVSDALVAGPPQPQKR
jgi:hypothetical protein